MAANETWEERKKIIDETTRRAVRSETEIINEAVEQICEHAESVKLLIELLDYDAVGTFHFTLILEHPTFVDEFLGHFNGLMDVRVIDQTINEEKCRFWRERECKKVIDL